MYRVDWTNKAKKGIDRCIHAGCGKQLSDMLRIVENNPYDPSQGFERLRGNLKTFCSRRINKGNRFLYEVLPNTENAMDDDGNLYDGIIRVYEAWGHRYKNPD